MSEPSNLNSASNDIQQSIHGERNQAIGQVYGSLIVYGNITVNSLRQPVPTNSESSQTLGPNPYKGLLAFHEADSHRYFGRTDEIHTLWEDFRALHEREGAVRLLPIYGPSGSGKSSLARAGLVPEIGDRPLAGRDRARVAVTVPGTRPLYNLAAVLARIAENESSPARKTREFDEELSLANKQGKFDGLQRIASILPDISTLPLIVLIDQFEEVYSQCEDIDERNQFIANLLCAASDRSQYVSVILTFRSDFLGETHRHPTLNHLFSHQGYLVPTMDEKSLREAILQPAQQSGYTLTSAIVDRLVQETEGREGTLPLLQVALTRIWQNLPEKDPAQTLREIGGVGGALVDEAERLYQSLSQAKQAIARRIFLGLIQLGEGTQDTRRRVNVNNLIAAQDAPEEVQSVIRQFAGQSARLITLSSDGNIETAEVTHEALLARWPRLRKWLDESRDDLRFQRRLEEDSQYWNQRGKPQGLLWRVDLDRLEDFARKSNDDPENLQLTTLQIEFYRASQQQRDADKMAEQKRIETERKLIESERQNIQVTKKLARVIIVSAFAFCSITLGVAIGSVRFAELGRIIEHVFLGVNSEEIVGALPRLEMSADKIEKDLDTLQKSVTPTAAVAHYQRNEEEFKKLFAYYRSIITALGRLKLENPQYFSEEQDRQLERVKKKLTDILIKYRLPQLRLHLENDKISEYLARPVTDLEAQYSEGSARTTYEIVMTNSGAGADLNKDGFIADDQEVAQMPCQLLVEIEKIWRELTKDACGWYSPDGNYAKDSGCTQLNEDRSTLSLTVFYRNTPHAINHIKKECKIPPA